MVLNPKLKKLSAAMQAATSYDEWRDAALAHDAASGANRWKGMDQSNDYDFVSIRTRLDHLRKLRARKDDRGLLFVLNEGIHGNMGGMGRVANYGHAKFGTKHLIVEYVEEIARALEHIASHTIADVSFHEKLDFFRRASHCFGRSALMMSGSGTLLYFHIGMARALWREGLLPDIISGSSGGAIVGSILCASDDEELDRALDPEHLPGIDEQEGWINQLLAHVRPERVTAADVWQTLEEHLPDYTFQEAFERTGRHMNVSVAPVESLQKSRLLNADTSPNVFMREAVLASTAFPGFFPAVILMAKNDKGERQAYNAARKWVDGSLSEDLPAKRLARLYGVNHYIVSQTNPFIIPFIGDQKRKTDAVSMVKYGVIDSARTWINAGAAVMDRPLSKVPEVKRLSNSLLSVINQSYVGDINILPRSKLHNPLRALAWRTHEEIAKLVEEGERCTWPHIERIRIQTRISRTLDSILNEYEELHIKKIRRAGTKRKVKSAPSKRKAS